MSKIEKIAFIILAYELVLDAVFGIIFYKLNPGINCIVMVCIAIWEVFVFSVFISNLNAPEEYYED